MFIVGEILSLTVFISFYLYNSHPASAQCHYIFPNISEIVNGIKIDALPVGFIPRSSTSNNLRIRFEYSESFMNYPGASALQADIMDPARLSLQSMITVNNPINGILTVDRQCIGGTYRINSKNERGCTIGCNTATTCLGVNVPEKYLKMCKVQDSNGTITTTGSDGVGEPNVDIILLVTYTSCPSGVLAYAAACFQEAQLDRPIMGILNLCSGLIVSGQNVRDNILIIRHEIIHALGFAVDKYAFYRNPDGTPIVPRDKFGIPTLGISTYGFYMWNDKIIKVVNRKRSSVTTQYTKTFYALVLPNVVAVARDHYACPNINEIELEDAGSMGSAFSHFDEYVLYNELMTPEFNGWNDRLSKFSLALLKDTGWYDVDYSKADNLLYGKGTGCLLLSNGCYEYMESQRMNNLPIDPFCDTANGQTLQCDPTRKYYEYCRIVEDATRPVNYRYLKSVKGVSNNDPNKYGGHSEFSEFCPMKAVPYNLFVGHNSDCSDLTNEGKASSFTPLPSGYGKNSICFDTIVPGKGMYGATCMNYTYDGSSASYSICIGGTRMTCTENEIKQYTYAYDGTASISCPKPSSLIKNDFGTPFVCQLSTMNTLTTTISLTTKEVIQHGYSLLLMLITSISNINWHM